MSKASIEKYTTYIIINRIVRYLIKNNIVYEI
nr:MAG TPA: protein of unknown function (DUF4224) [Crassvirales sp.]